MKCIIIGAGKVGFNIAQMLSMEDHDVVVIEQDEERMKVIDEVLDVQVIKGSGSSWSILEEAGVHKADMLVAVTEADELNMIACLIAKQCGVTTTVARVRNPEYAETPVFSTGQLVGIDLIINPERVTAYEISKIVKNPEALSVEYYANGRVKMIELEVDPRQIINGVKLKELDTSKFVIVSITRQQMTIVPTGEDVITAGDRIFVMANTADIPEVLFSLGVPRRRIESLTILGAGRTGYYLAQILEKSKPPMSIKIIEKDPRRAREVAEKLKHCLVINGDGSELTLLQEENIGESDLFIAVTDDDKLNILSSLIAKNLGVQQTISKVKRSDMMPLMDQIGIDIVLSPRLLTAGAILRYIRRGDIVAVTVLGEDQAEMIELVAQPGSVAVNKKLKDIRFPSGSVLGAIVRDDKVIIPSGNNEIKANDHLMVFSLFRSIHKVEKLFINGGGKK